MRSLAQMKEAADGIALAPILAMARRQVLDPHIHGRNTVGRSRSHSLTSAPSSHRPSRSATPAEAAEFADAAVLRRRSPNRSKSAVRPRGDRPGGLDDLAGVRSGVETTRSRSVDPRGRDRDVDDEDGHGAAMAPRRSHLSRSSLQPPSSSVSSKPHLGRQRQYSEGE